VAKRKAAPRARRREPQSPRAISGRQRQRLIEACISALHVHGPSQTTVEKVVAIAKLSPGIVRFYFDSKAAMLVASLRFLAGEFEEQVLVPVSRLKRDPVRALKLLVDLYLDAQIASPRKVSVWYSFWGEASSRKEYYDLCGKKDESFAALVLDLVGSMIEAGGYRSLDPDGVALGLIGVLEVLWQDFAFQDESVIDRSAAHARAMSYLSSVFPAEFGAEGSLQGSVEGGPEGSASRARARRAAADVEVPRANAQLIGHRGFLPVAGSYLALDGIAERVLAVRDDQGKIRVFRNCCPRGTHALAESGLGTFDRIIECPLHSLRFALDGRAQKNGARLHGLAHREAGGFLCLETGARDNGVAARWLGLLGRLDYLAPLPWIESIIEADWSILVGQWMEAGESAGGRQAYAYPNQLIELRDDGATISQVLPLQAGRSTLREFPFAHAQETRRLRVLRYLAERRRRDRRRRIRTWAESAQSGMDRFGYRAGPAASRSSGERLRASLAQLTALESN
jgi:TetR/AcrR family transcriptional repressor of bet genes